MIAPSPIIVVSGPTAVGKTALGIALAERLGGEIIGADSRQIYRMLDIGTGKPSASERARVPHHLIDVADPDEVFSAARFSSMAAEVIASLDARGSRAVVVGGTGLYIRALRTGLFPAPRRDESLRGMLRERAAAEGTAALHRELAVVDPEAAARIHPNDEVRIVRALEVWEGTGVPISRLQRERTSPPLPGRRFVHLVLRRDQRELDALIAQRVNAMVEAGWAAEVERVLASGYGPDCPGMQSLGYRTMARAAAGAIGIAEATEAVVRETGRYARRQATWFRGEQGTSVVDLTGRRPDDALADVMAIVRETVT